MPGLETSTTSNQVIKFIDFSGADIKNNDVITLGNSIYSFGSHTPDLTDPKTGMDIILSRMVDVINSRAGSTAGFNVSAVAELRNNSIVFFGKVAGLDFILGSNTVGAVIDSIITAGKFFITGTEPVDRDFMAIDVLTDVVINLHEADLNFIDGDLSGASIPVGYHEISGASIRLSSGTAILYLKP